MTLPWREVGARPIFWQPRVNPFSRTGPNDPLAPAWPRPRPACLRLPMHNRPLPLGVLVPITCSSERARSP